MIIEVYCDALSLDVYAEGDDVQVIAPGLNTAKGLPFDDSATHTGAANVQDAIAWLVARVPA